MWLATSGNGVGMCRVDHIFPVLKSTLLMIISLLRRTGWFGVATLAIQLVTVGVVVAITPTVRLVTAAAVPVCVCSSYRKTVLR